MTGETCYTQDESMRLKGYITKCEKLSLDFKSIEKAYKQCDEDYSYSSDCSYSSDWHFYTGLALTFVAGFFIGSSTGR